MTEYMLCQKKNAVVPLKFGCVYVISLYWFTFKLIIFNLTQFKSELLSASVTVRIFYKPYIATQSLTNRTSKTSKEKFPFKRKKPSPVPKQGAGYTAGGRELKARPFMILSEALGTTSKAALWEQSGLPEWSIKSPNSDAKVSLRSPVCFDQQLSFQVTQGSVAGLAAWLGCSTTCVSFKTSLEEDATICSSTVFRSKSDKSCTSCLISENNCKHRERNDDSNLGPRLRLTRWLKQKTIACWNALITPGREQRSRSRADKIISFYQQNFKKWNIKSPTLWLKSVLLPQYCSASALSPQSPPPLLSTAVPSMCSS